MTPAAVAGGRGSAAGGRGSAAGGAVAGRGDGELAARGGLLQVIDASVGADEALRLAAAAAGETVARLEARVLYPYYRFEATCRLPTLAGRRDTRLECLVDAVNGIASTAAPFGCRSESGVGHRLLDVAITAEAAGRIAARTAAHNVSRKLRLMADLGLAVSGGDIVYKRFWLIRAGSERLLLDSVTGGLHPLTACAA